MTNEVYLHELKKLIVRHFEDACNNLPENQRVILQNEGDVEGALLAIRREELNRIESVSAILRTAEAMRRRLPPGQLLGQFLRSDADKN